ncbi:protein timeless homolog isoform X2 [Dendrobates tinctorius]|uniref:protein timeless homolog isoform X2 n=1 Tax=Dendrobates tinctorius TaxID=92724 RepID=UPI003CC9E283
MDLYMMNCELLATCSALGYLEGDTYHKEPDCLESVKDLIRYLRHEDETRDIRQQLGAAQILQNDLVPLVIQHHNDKQLFDAVVRLMVNLTQPALLCFGKVPQDPTFRHHFLQVVSYLQAYKEAFANERLFVVLSEKLYDLLQMNVDDDASIHDKVLWAIHMSGMDDLVKFLASSETEQQWSMHVLETVSLMFRDQNAEQLAATGQGRFSAERATDLKDLEILRQREMAEKKSRVFQRGTRHSRFGGSYIIQGLKSIGDKDIIYHKGLHNFENYTHDLGKEFKRVPRRKQQAKEAEMRHRSALNVRFFLKEFCVDFLENCYNRLMFLVKDHLIRERAQQHDETYYLWSMAFFMAFNRVHKFRPEFVSETASIRTFHFIEQNLTNYYEMMLTDKKEATSWARRMHLALKAYQELLMTINEMDHSKDGSVRESSKVIKNNIFYMMEYRELFLALFRKFDETKQPRSFLKDLVETTHLFLKMLEKFCKGKSTVMVQSRKVKKKKKKPSRREEQPKSSEELEEIWQSLSEKLKNCATDSEGLPDEMVPFDAASEIPVEEQRTEALVRIQNGLQNGQAGESLVLLRSAREVWPEGDVFGSPESGPEEELELLKQILFADLPRSTQIEADLDEEDEAEEVEEEELTSVQVSEREFTFLDYMKRFANANVVKTYVILLKNYHHNSAHTNHCVVKMLHRIAYDLKMEAFLFQLSVFCIFNRILCDPAAGAYKELVAFSKYILNKFFALAATNNKAYVELLFWKNTNLIREITEGYRKPDEEESTANRKRIKWTPQDEEELQSLYLQFKEVEGVDVIDNILANLKPGTRTRKQIINHLVQMGLADSVMDFKKEIKGTRIVLWTEDQEMELQRLYEEFQETDDILGNVMKHITAKRSKARIIEKLISMGLVSERKELYKRRRRKGKSSGISEDDFLHDLGIDGKNVDIEDSYDEDDDDDMSDEHEEEHIKLEQKPKAKLSRNSDVFMDKKIQTILRSVHEEGLSSPVMWLQNCLYRTADDREEDGSSQSVPLVPLTEDNEDAMENKTFQKLLKLVGIRPPANEQESFWRIPAKLNPDQLRKFASSLVLSSTEECVETPTESDVQDPNLEQRAEALRALLLARKKTSTTAPLEPEEINPQTDVPSTLPEMTNKRATKPSKKRQFVDSDDDNEQEEKEEVIKEIEEQNPDVSSENSSERSKVAMKRSRIIDSDDEELLTNDQDEQPKTSGEATDSENEDLQPSKKKRLRIEDEDED